MELRWNSDIKHGIRNYCTWTWTTSWSLSSKKELQVLDSFGDLTFFLSRQFTQLPRWGADLVGRLVTSIQPASGLPGALASAVCFLSHQTQPKPHIASYRIISHHIASYGIIHTLHVWLACSLFRVWQLLHTFTNYKLSRFTSMVHRSRLQAEAQPDFDSYQAVGLPRCGSGWIRPCLPRCTAMQGICVRIIIILYPAHSE
jgi:hypothetical protein